MLVSRLANGRRKKRRKSSSDESEESKESSESNLYELPKRRKKKPKKRVEKEESSSKSEEEEEKKKSEPDLIDINVNSIDFTKCYICLNFPNEPAICSFCGNLACKKCLDKWMENNSRCGVCRHNMTKKDIISPIITKKLTSFMNEIDKIKDKETRDICDIHKEKILFFCMKCLKKYCGKCLFFGSEETKKHQGHNIIDYDELIKSDYYNIINEVNQYQENRKKDEGIEESNTYKEEINIIYDKGKIVLEKFQKMLDIKLKEKYDIFNKHSNDLETAKKNLDKKYDDLITNLNKLENINKKIENFEPKLAENEFISNKNLIKTIRENPPKMELNINFCLKNFVKIFTYQEIIKSKEKDVDITYPYEMKMKLIKEGEKEFLEFEAKNKDKPPFILFLYIKFNNKIYHFKKIEKEEKKENDNIIISNYNDAKEESDTLNNNKNSNNIIINIEKSENEKQNNENKKEEEKKDETLKIKKMKKVIKEIIYVAHIPKNELNEIINNLFYFYNYEFNI